MFGKVGGVESKKDNEIFMYSYVKKYGINGFKKASNRLKSDAKFVLDLVKVCPECLLECEDVLFDRFEKDGEMVEMPIERNIFNAMCCENNVDAFKYMKKVDAKNYLQSVEQGLTLEGDFQGKSVSIELEADKDYIDLLKYVRFGYLKTDSLYVACEAK